MRVIEQTAETIDRAFSLSRVVTDRGHCLTGHQQIVLEVAQLLHRRFRSGAAVQVKTIKRLCRNYHGLLRSDVNQTILQLVDAGVIRLSADVLMRSVTLVDSFRD